jgi:hypothetical protein
MVSSRLDACPHPYRVRCNAIATATLVTASPARVLLLRNTDMTGDLEVLKVVVVTALVALSGLVRLLG